MTEFSPLHWIIVFFVLFAMTGVPFFLAYRYGSGRAIKKGMLADTEKLGKAQDSRLVATVRNQLR